MSDNVRQSSKGGANGPESATSMAGGVPSPRRPSSTTPWPAWRQGRDVLRSYYRSRTRWPMVRSSQEASVRALENGTTPPMVLDYRRELRERTEKQLGNDGLLQSHLPEGGGAVRGRLPSFWGGRADRFQTCRCMMAVPSVATARDVGMDTDSTEQRRWTPEERHRAFTRS